MSQLRLSLLLLLLTGFFISCASSRPSTVQDYESAALSKAPQEGQVERKIIYSANLTLSVDNPNSTNSTLKQIANKYEGYFNEIGTYRTVIRVKSDYLNEATDEIATLGKVESKSLSGRDVTEEFMDYQIRLENAQKARDRYLELLAQAENVEATLKVEKELERLNEKIELLKGRIKRINHLSDYSTISIQLKKKKKPGILGYVSLGIYHSVKWLFVRN